MFNKCTIVVSDSVRKRIEEGQSDEDMRSAFAFAYDIVRLGTLMAYGEELVSDLDLYRHYGTDYFRTEAPERARLVSAMIRSTEVVARISTRALDGNTVVDVHCYDGIQASRFWSLHARFESGHVHIEE